MLIVDIKLNCDRISSRANVSLLSLVGAGRGVCVCVLPTVKEQFGVLLRERVVYRLILRLEVRNQN